LNNIASMEKGEAVEKKRSELVLWGRRQRGRWSDFVVGREKLDLRVNKGRRLVGGHLTRKKPNANSDGKFGGSLV